VDNKSTAVKKYGEPSREDSINMFYIDLTKFDIDTSNGE
jgi:hypothetical protein